MKIISHRHAVAELIAISFIVLFQELTLIRWLPGQIRVLAYFPNIVLIGAFLGLGIGSLRAGKQSLLWLWPAAILTLIGAAVLLAGVAFTSQLPSEHLWLLYYDIPDAPVINDIRPPIIAAFILCALAFVPLGQMIGERLHIFSIGRGSLWGYSADLTGSLLGVTLFALASFLKTFPILWFAIFLIPGIWFFLRRGPGSAFIYLLAAATALTIVARTEKAQYYSPYYALSAITESSSGVNILANGSIHQYAAPLSKARTFTNEYDALIQAGYPFPYERMNFAPKRVLVLGAGSGNDVAVALEHGAERVDAVEIDPVIIDLGRRLHPEKPYASPRVRIINEDARSYIKNTKETYDLIVFGTLDSMTRLSALSNVRLDNFVYTRECLEKARSRLTPRGGVALYFMISSRHIANKLFFLLNDTFGQPPLVWNKHCHLFNAIFLSGPAFDHLYSGASSDTKQLESARRQTELPTDDWPYLYLKKRGVSGFYLSMIALFTILSIAGICCAEPRMLRSVKSSVDGEMFFFGMAFLLIETRLVTQMNLVWGATWLTSAIVFASILFMVLLGTVLMQMRPLASPIPEIGLFGALLLTYMAPTQQLLSQNISLRLALSVLFAGLPIFFASICFAIRFKKRNDQETAFGWNLLGAVIGGLLEFLSMAIGLRSLTIIAMACYGAAILAGRNRLSVEFAHVKKKASFVQKRGSKNKAAQAIFR